MACTTTTVETRTEEAHAGVADVAAGTGPMAEHPLVIEAFRLQDEARARGGIEPGSAGFHRFPGDAMASLVAWPVFLAERRSDGAFTGTAAQMKVDIRRDDVLTRCVVEADVIAAGGFHDVRVRFSSSVLSYASDRQLARERAFLAGKTPPDRGVALVHHDFIYGELTFGEIARGCSEGEGWVTVVTGTSLGEATAIARALRP